MVRCKMCGFDVEVGPDGRCRFGHRVRPADPGYDPRKFIPPEPDESLVDDLGAIETGELEMVGAVVAPVKAAAEPPPIVPPKIKLKRPVS